MNFVKSRDNAVTIKTVIVKSDYVAKNTDPTPSQCSFTRHFEK